MKSERFLARVSSGFLALALCLAAGPTQTLAYSPEDPEVRSMVDRAIAYLEGLPEEDLKLKSQGDPEGQPMLIAYAHLKAEGDLAAPLVQTGIKNAIGYTEKIRRNAGASRSHGHKSIYEMSVAIMLLAEVDARAYADDLQFLADSLLSEQMAHGGYGYHGEPHGDSSQVQYVSLAMWTLDRAGFEFDYERAGRLTSWIVRAQDPTGYWTYQPELPGPGKGLVAQPKRGLTISTCLAAGSALLIAADVLRQWGQTEGLQTTIDGLPKAVKLLPTDLTSEQKRNTVRKQAAKVSPAGIRGAINRMESYRAQNPFKRTGSPDWYYYMLYTMERYESFMEIATSSAGNIAWYDEGVTSLMKLQDDSGAWGVSDASMNSPPVSTAFAVLFLIRSTKKSIVKASQGTVAGGFGLPSDTSKIVVSGTQIKGEPVAGAVTDLLSLLEEDDSDQFDQKSIPDDLRLETDPQRRRQQLERLERLVRGSQSWQARRVAAKLLGSSDELTVVPSLIFALSDPDTVVRRSAVEGLRFISRRFNDFDMPDKPDSQEIRKAQQEWRQWYQSIYPGYVFLDAPS